MRAVSMATGDYAPGGGIKAAVTGIKRDVKPSGVYVYHRASGARLPDLPASDPRFIDAYRAAEVEYQNRIKTAAQRINPMPIASINHNLPVPPDAVIFAISHAVSWVFSSRAGDVVYYHYGAISADQVGNPSLQRKSAYFRLIGDFGLVRLRQRRAAEGLTHYYAARTDVPLRNMPQNVLSGAVEPIDYGAVLAVLERQPAQSVARCLRDALALSERDSAALRNDMIRRGWLTNGRPPELTELGLSVLA